MSCTKPVATHRASPPGLTCSTALWPRPLSGSCRLATPLSPSFQVGPPADPVLRDWASLPRIRFQEWAHHFFMVVYLLCIGRFNRLVVLFPVNQILAQENTMKAAAWPLSKQGPWLISFLSIQSCAQTSRLQPSPGPGMSNGRSPVQVSRPP